MTEILSISTITNDLRHTIKRGPLYKRSINQYSRSLNEFFFGEGWKYRYFKLYSSSEYFDHQPKPARASLHSFSQRRRTQRESFKILVYYNADPNDPTYCDDIIKGIALIFDNDIVIQTDNSKVCSFDVYKLSKTGEVATSANKLFLKSDNASDIYDWYDKISEKHER